MKYERNVNFQKNRRAAAGGAPTDLFIVPSCALDLIENRPVSFEIRCVMYLWEC